MQGLTGFRAAVYRDNMIDKATAISTVLKRLRKLPVGHVIDLRTYKRDRSVLIRREEEDLFYVREDGFEKNEFRTSIAGMKKLLKTLLKIEFPRSTKIRLYNLGQNDSNKKVRMKRL